MLIDSRKISDLYMRMVVHNQAFYECEMDPKRKNELLTENSMKEMGALLLIKGLEATYNQKILQLPEVEG